MNKLEEEKKVINDDVKNCIILKARDTEEFKRLTEQKNYGLELSKYDLNEMFEKLEMNYSANANADCENFEEFEIAELNDYESVAIQKAKHEILELLEK